MTQFRAPTFCFGVECRLLTVKHYAADTYSIGVTSVLFNLFLSCEPVAYSDSAHTHTFCIKHNYTKYEIINTFPLWDNVRPYIHLYYV